MALGGGTFLVQNKVLPGSYINFVSVAKASATLSDRGYGTMAFELDWGIDDEVFEVTNGDFQKESLKLFGYDYTSEKLRGLRDLFLNLSTLYAYRLNSGGEKASCDFGTAKHTGTRGNDLKLIIESNVDDETIYDFTLYLGDIKIDEQSVSNTSELVDNDFVIWKKNVEIIETVGIPFIGGSNGTVTGASHQSYLDKIEAFSFNIIGVVTVENTIKQLYANFTKRMRDEIGAKFQVVLHNYAGDYEGIINIKNNINNENWSIASLVYWVVGLEANCAVNKSCLNRKYNGEFTVLAEYTQSQLIKAINAGEFTLHKVGDDLRVLSDINSMVTVSDTKGDVFKDNQTIRVIDQIANDIANLFNTRYLGTVPNDKAGRTSLWADIVKHHEQLQDIRAIENFSDKDVVVEQGDSKKAVEVTDYITVINAMAQLYMTVRVA